MRQNSLGGGPVISSRKYDPEQVVNLRRQIEVIVDRGRRHRKPVGMRGFISRLKRNLSALRETGDAELLKLGELCNMAIPSQALSDREVSGRKRVETRRAAPKDRIRIRDMVKG